MRNFILRDRAVLGDSGCLTFEQIVRMRLDVGSGEFRRMLELESRMLSLLRRVVGAFSGFRWRYMHIHAADTAPGFRDDALMEGMSFRGGKADLLALRSGLAFADLTVSQQDFAFQLCMRDMAAVGIVSDEGVTLCDTDEDFFFFITIPTALDRTGLDPDGWFEWTPSVNIFD